MTLTALHLRGSRWQLGRALCLLIACSLPVPTHAADRPPAGLQNAEYERLVEEAVREYRRTHFPEARSLFARAHELFPNARTWRGLGMVEFELRNYVDSVICLERALSAQAKPLTGPLRESTELLLGRAAAFVGRFTIVSERAVTVSVDDAPRALEEDSMLTLPVGDHALVFVSADGFVQRRMAHVRGGEHETLQLTRAPTTVELPAGLHEPVVWDLSAQARAVDVAAPTAKRDVTSATSEPRRDKPLYKRAWLWSAVGVVVAGAATGLALGLTRRAPEQRDPIAEWPAATLKGP